MPSGTFPEIARWWRRRQGRRCLGLNEDTLVKSTNPRTLLLGVTSTPERSGNNDLYAHLLFGHTSTLRSKDGLDFIRSRVDALQRRLRVDGEDPEARFMLAAMYLEKLGDDHLEEALREMDGALTRMRRKESGAKSERARLAKACRALKVRKHALSGAREAGTLPRRPRAGDANVQPGKRQKRSPQEERGVGRMGGEEEGESVGDEPLRDCCVRFQPIDERDASQLGYEEFIEKYALPGRPVILKGGASQCFEGGLAWSRECLRKEAGNKTVTVRRWVPGSVSWARLEEAGQIRLAELLADSTWRSCRGSSVDGEVVAVSGDTSISGEMIETPQSWKSDDHARLGEGEAQGEGASAGCGNGGGHEVQGGGGVNFDRDGGHHGARLKVRAVEDDLGEREPLYLHDWSVPQNLGQDCSLLEGRFKVPKFFAGDMLQRVAGRGLPYTDSWPSLFVGPKGSKSDTHVDSFGSHFWMALLEGKKRWLLYPKQAAPLLYPIWPEGCHDPVFEGELEAPDATQHPAVLLARGFQCVLEAGDVLFVPAGCPHRVENLTDTMAVSCNYVDATNVEGALEALGDQALTDPGADALASALRGCDSSLVRGQRGVAWKTLKTWPRDGETVVKRRDMGCCESIMRVIRGGGTADGGNAEIELGSSGPPFTMHGMLRGKDVVVDRMRVSGDGLALGCAPVEQDSAYWEVVITSLPPGGTVSLGVSRRPPPDGESDALLGRSKMGEGEKTWGFCTSDGGAAAEVKEGDVIGVALDFTDLPMLFFSRGGAPLGRGDELAVMRIRGTVYPAIGVSGGAKVTLAFAARELRHAPPRKCQALVVGQDMI